jgi:hypothetical protein
MARVIKTIRGRQYYYDQTSQRVDGKVVTTSIYIGPANPRRSRAPTPDKPTGRGPDWYQIEREMAARQAAEKMRTEAFATKMHDLYGMDLSRTTHPVEKHVAPDPLSYTTPPAVPATESAQDAAQSSDATPAASSTDGTC